MAGWLADAASPLGLEFLRRTRQKMARTISPRKAKPPTMPPQIAPIGVGWLLELEEWWEVATALGFL
jgi:hypothetical protein